MKDLGWWSGRTAESWRVGRLKDLVEVTNGFPFDATRFSDARGTPLIRIRDLLRGYTETYFDGHVPDVAIVHDGDLLIGMDGDFNSGIWTGGTAALNQRMCRLRARHGFDQQFLRYLVDLPLRFINDLTYSTTVKHLSSSDLLNERIPLPPLGVQRAIADYLDHETARIDALITKKQRLIELLDEAFVSEIGAACGQLTKCDPIKRIAGVTYGLGQPPTLSDPSDGTVPIIRATNIDRGSIDSADLIHARIEDLPLGRAPLLREGEILVVRSGALTGDSARITGEWVGAAPGYDLRVTPTSIDSRLLAWQLLGAEVGAQLQLVRMRAAQPHLNAEDLGAVMVRTGGADSEVSVADRLDSAAARTRQLVAGVSKQVVLLREHRQALITAAVTGEIEVPGVAA